MADPNDRQDTSDDSESDDPGSPGIVELLRDVGAFQFKLIADSARDLFLSPISIILAVVGIISRPNDPAYLFRRLLRFGVRTDRWINLFNSHESKDGDEATSDKLLRDVETLVVEEWKRKQLREETPANGDLPKAGQIDEDSPGKDR